MPTRYEPNGEAADMKLAPSLARAVAVDQDSPARERSSTTDGKILTALTALDERMVEIESSQRKRDKHNRMLDIVESGIFALVHGAIMCVRPMTIDALSR